MSSKTELEQKVIDIFVDTLGYSAEYLVQAPGRVNLIGEHTDYNDGFVMPCAINYQTVIAAARRDDNIIRVYSVDYDQFDEFDVTQAIESVESKMWANYIRGVVKHLLARGYQFGGADIAVSGNVPQGAGLSSSAALEVVVGQCFKALYQLDISQQDIALVGQEAENQFVGCNCGIMDQLISAKGATGQALLIDCRSLETELVSLPQDVEILIINSNKKRGLVDSEYNTRREQCESAAASFGVKALRDVNIAQFEAHQDQLDPVVAMRARHVITENQRTEEAAVAMQNNDMVRLAELMAESHASMRDDFEITVKEIDAIVDMVKQELGTEGGVRMTGGGFGGCVVALVPPHKLDAVLARIEADYEPLTGLKASTYICQPMSGAGSVELISSLA